MFYIGKEVKINVRRDLAFSELTKSFRFDGSEDFVKKMVSKFGWHESGEGKIFCRDYSMPKSTFSRQPAAIYGKYPSIASEEKGYVVIPDDEWVWHELIQFMWDNGLKPASFYQHIALAARYAEDLKRTGRQLVSFGGFTNPQRMNCAGLVIINNEEIRYSEGGAGYSRGGPEAAKKVAFSATKI